MTDRPRVVWLRSGEDGRYLSAYLDSDGRLHLDGEDFGPKIRVVTNRDSYEYEQTIKAEDVPKLCELLGGRPDEHILEVLARDWCGVRADYFGAVLDESGIDVALYVR
jgi:hypothetical protein